MQRVGSFKWIVIISTFGIALGVIYCIQKSKNERINFNYSKDVQQSVEQYLSSAVVKTGFDGKTICTTSFLGADSSALYIFYYCQELFYQNSVREIGTGEAGPIAIYYKTNGQNIQIMSHERPRDGNLYSLDVERIFPSWVRSHLLKSEEEIKKLSSKLRKIILILYE